MPTHPREVTRTKQNKKNIIIYIIIAICTMIIIYMIIIIISIIQHSHQLRMANDRRTCRFNKSNTPDVGKVPVLNVEKDT